MNNIRRIIALALVLSFVAGIAFAGDNFRVDPISAVDASTRVQNIVDRFAFDGYELQEVQPLAHHYLVAPTGNYVWGTVKITLTYCHGSGGGCRAVDYTEIEAEVSYVDGKGYKVSKVTTTEWTFWT